MLHTFVALVDDKPGVLTRIAFLFSRLNVNIVSASNDNRLQRTRRALNLNHVPGIQ